MDAERPGPLEQIREHPRLADHFGLGHLRRDLHPPDFPEAGLEDLLQHELVQPCALALLDDGLPSVHQFIRPFHVIPILSVDKMGAPGNCTP